LPGQWRGNRQDVSWFTDLWRRGLLELDPPYQRRSVWNQRYRQEFIETVLLGYPAPSIFLYAATEDDGTRLYSVVDGKQRLTAILDFVEDNFQTPDDDSPLTDEDRGKYFSGLADKSRVWTYEFTVEYLPSTDESLLKDVFDRINRNVARLTRQELRHARFAGAFATQVESLVEDMVELLPPNFPRIVESSRRQMKDVEFVVTLALLIEQGPEATSQDDLDRIYSDRDEDWEASTETTRTLRSIWRYIAEVAEAEPELLGTRLRNQGDFYALVGAVHEISEGNKKLPKAVTAARRLKRFIDRVSDIESHGKDEVARRYSEAARSAVNDRAPRETRIASLVEAITSG